MNAGEKKMNWKNLLLHSDLYFAIVAIGTGLAAYAIYGLPLSDPAPLAVIFFLALNVCATNRQIDEEVDSVNVPERTRFLMRHGKTIYYLSVAGLVVALVIAFDGSPWAGAAALFTFISGHFYSHPFPRVGRLREFFIIKNMTVGLMWALMALITPLYFGLNEMSIIGPLFLLFFMRMTFQTGLIDLRDVEGDEKAGIKTVPILLGRGKTLGLAQLVNLFPVLVFYILSHFFGISQDFVLLSSLMSINGFIYIIGITFDFKTDWMYAVGIDSETLLPSLFLLLIKMYF